MTQAALCSTAANYSRDDQAYVAGHRFMYGELGEHVATTAILLRDRLLRPGFVLPVIRLAPVAPYGKCMALAGNGGSLSHAAGMSEGIWLYLHEKWYGAGLLDTADETTLHELLHNELPQFGEDPKHKSAAWAQRCQGLSDRLGLGVKIERPRSVRRGGMITTGVPDGCLPYPKLASWPADLLAGGPPLRARVLQL